MMDSEAPSLDQVNSLKFIPRTAVRAARLNRLFPSISP